MVMGKIRINSILHLQKGIQQILLNIGLLFWEWIVLLVGIDKAISIIDQASEVVLKVCCNVNDNAESTSLDVFY